MSPFVVIQLIGIFLGVLITFVGGAKKASTLYAKATNPPFPLGLFYCRTAEKKYWLGSAVSPVIAIVLAIVFCVLLYPLLGTVNGFLQWFASILTSLISMIPVEPIREALTTACSFLFSAASLPYLLNLMILGVFLVAKRLYVPLADRILRESGLEDSDIMRRFFVRDELSGKWVLKVEYVGLRRFLQAGYVSVALVIVIIFAIVQAFPWLPIAAIPFYPVVTLIILTEILAFLAAPSAEELKTDIYGEADRSTRISDYGLLRDTLKGTFGDRLLADSLMDASYEQTDSLEMLERLKESENDSVRVLASYFEGLKQDGQQVNVNYLDAAVTIIEGRNIVISNPFYNDYTAYLLFPLYLRLLDRQKVLVLVGSDTVCEDILDWLRLGLEDISGIPDLWRMGYLNECEDLMLDIGIIRLPDIYNQSILSKQASWLATVGFVLIAQPSAILATAQLGLSIVALYCQGYQESGNAPVVVAFDRPCDGLVDSISHCMRQEFTEVYAPQMAAAPCTEMIWSASGDFMQTKIFPNTTRYLGCGTELAAVALRNQVEQVDWYSDTRFPVVDMHWIAGQYYAAITEYANIERTQEALGQRVQAVANIFGTKQRENNFAIIEDEYNNAYSMVRLYLTRGQNQNFVNVISENYLLRDYMVANDSIFTEDIKAVPTITPDFVRTPRNAVMKLLLLMRAREVGESEIEHELRLAAVEFGSGGGIKKLNDLIEEYVGIRSFSKLLDSDARISLDEQGEEHFDERRYWLPTVIADEQLKRVLSALQLAYYYEEEEIDESHYIGACLYGLLYQVVLPGQHITVGGKYYLVESFVDDVYGAAKTVTLKRAADHIEERISYRNIIRMQLDTLKTEEGIGAVVSYGEIELRSQRVGFRVSTDGYLQCTDRGDLLNARLHRVSDLPLRHYRNKSLLQIVFPESMSPRTLTLLALLLEESFVTLFPEGHHFLRAGLLEPEFIEGLPENMRLGSVAVEVSAQLLEDLDDDARDALGRSLLVFEDADIDLGYLTAFRRSWTRIMVIIDDFLKWYEAAQTPPSHMPVPQLPDDWNPHIEEQMKPHLGFWARIRKWFDDKLHGKKRRFGRKRKGSDEVIPIQEDLAEGDLAEGELESESEGEAAVEPELDVSPEDETNPSGLPPVITELPEEADDGRE